MKTLALSAFALVAMAGCSNIEDNAFYNEGRNPVAFVMNVDGTTRTVIDKDSRVVSWKEGDAVGIFVYQKGTTDTPVRSNMKYVLKSDGTWSATDLKNIIYSDEAYDYYAYYPYMEGVEDASAIAIGTSGNQSGDDFAECDILAAKTSAEAKVTSIAMDYSHMFSMVEVKVQGGSDVISQPEKVILTNVKLGATLNLTGGTAPAAVVNSDESVKDVVMNYVKTQTEGLNTNCIYRALVPAQSVSAKTGLVTVVNPLGNGKSYRLTFAENVSFNAGRCRQLIVNFQTEDTDTPELIVGKDDFAIGKWGEDGEIAGDSELAEEGDTN